MWWFLFKGLKNVLKIFALRVSKIGVMEVVPKLDKIKRDAVKIHYPPEAEQSLLCQAKRHACKPDQHGSSRRHCRCSDGGGKTIHCDVHLLCYVFVVENVTQEMDFAMSSFPASIRTTIICPSIVRRSTISSFPASIGTTINDSFFSRSLIFVLNFTRSSDTWFPYCIPIKHSVTLFLPVISLNVFL